jgi:purine-binding chemotaxis protein CheW
MAAIHALPGPGDDRTADQQQYLTFVLGGETYAVGILAIKEIIEFGRLTTVPMMPAFVRGVINLRGAVVPVIDLEARFGRGETRVGRRSCIVIVEIAAEDGAQVVGILVDQVNEVMEIPATEIEPAPAFGAGLRPDFIAGMARQDSGFVVILAMAAVLSVDELARMAQGGAHPVASSEVALAA